MTDKIIDAAAAQGLQAYAVRTYRLSGWIVMPGTFGMREQACRPT